MSDKKVQKLVVSALMAALTYVATMVVQIPSPMNGYVNLGDCFVLLSGWLLGPWYGGAAAGIGSMLTDLLYGYGYYAPGTFVIKGPGQGRDLRDPCGFRCPPCGPDFRQHYPR